MKNMWYLFFSIVLIILALFLRLYQLENRAPFDWDQARDYQVVGEIVAGKMTLVGPVAKGEGGFLLGPLYYYLLLPGYLLTSGAPISLPYTSVLIDVLLILSILLLLPPIWGRAKLLGLATIWTFSWFAIESSRVSWNVALLPLWSVIFLALFSSSLAGWKKTLSLGIMAGLGWHIHASLIPLAPILILIGLFQKKLSWSALPSVALGYLLVLSPLIIFDLRHSFFNYQLLTQFAAKTVGTSATLLELLSSVFARFGKNTIAILTGTSDLHLVYGILGFCLAIYQLFFGTKLARLAGLITVFSVIQVLALKEVAFPEYYLGVAYLPMLIVLIDSLSIFPLKRFLLTGAILLVVILNLRQYNFTSTPFSLGTKLDLLEDIKSLGAPVAISYDLAFGRDIGVIPLVKYLDINVVNDAKISLIISEKMTGPLYLKGEPVEDLGHYGGMRLAKHVVQ